MGSFIESSDYVKVKNLFQDQDDHDDPPWAVKSKLVIVYGVSGRGKTRIGRQLAREFSRRVKEYDPNRDAVSTPSPSSALQSVVGRAPILYTKTINSISEDQFRSSLQEIVNDLKQTWNIFGDQRSDRPISLKDICTRFDTNGINCFLNFDNLPSTDDSKELNWRREFWTLLNSVNFSSLQRSKFLMMITTQGKLKDREFDEVEVKSHKMEGFNVADTREFLNKIFDDGIPGFWDEATINKLKEKLSCLPSAYEAAAQRIKSMSDQDELDDLETYGSKSIQEKLLRLPHLKTWKLLNIYSEGLRIPKEYFLIIISQQILTNENMTQRDSDQKLLKIARGFYAEMIDTYERHGFVTVHRSNPYRVSTSQQNNNSSTPGPTSEQMYVSIQDLAMRALKGLPEKQGEAKAENSQKEKLNAVRAGLLALSKLLQRDDRHHKKTKRAPEYIPALISLANLLHDTLRADIFSSLTNCERLMYYELISAIYYDRLRKDVVRVSEHDLESMANSIIDLEHMLICPTPQQPDHGEPMQTDLAPTMEQKAKYELMMEYLKETDDEELKKMRRILHLTERDIRTIQEKLPEGDRDAAKPHGQDLLALSEIQYKTWEQNKVLWSLETFRKTYPLEVLSVMYKILGKMKKELTPAIGDQQQERNGLLSKSSHDDFKKAADILELVKHQHKKELSDLLERIVVNRDNLLDDEFNDIRNSTTSSGAQIDSLNSLEEKYNELMKIDTLAYEYGLLRSNMKEDYYNMLICCEKRMQILVLMIQRRSGRREEDQVALLSDKFCDAYRGVQQPDTTIQQPDPTKALGIRFFVANVLYPHIMATTSAPTNGRAYSFTLREIGRMLSSLCSTLRRVSCRYFTMSLKIIHPKPSEPVTDNSIRKLCKLIEPRTDNPKLYDGSAKKIAETFDVCICYEKTKLMELNTRPPCEVCKAESLKLNYLDKFAVDTLDDTIKLGIESLQEVLSQTPPT